MELEVETVLVLTKKLKLRTVSGKLIGGFIKVFECENPYVIVLLIDTEYGQSLRMDVHKEDLAAELRQWLEGKHVRNPAVLIPVRIDDAINRFVKFGKTPLQEDLIMWLLSRSELYLTNNPYIIFGGKSIEKEGEDEEKDFTSELKNDYSRNAMAAVKSDYLNEQQYRIEDTVGRGTKLEFSLPASSKPASLQYPTGNTGNKTQKTVTSSSEDQGMFAMTRKLLGKSATMEMLKTKKLKGREGSRQTISTPVWNNGTNLELITSIQKARKDIEIAMDERRRMIEVAKIRQIQASEKFRKIRNELEGKISGNKFLTTATQELLSLQNIEADIREDIKRQQNRAHRTAQKVSWTIAPNAFANRRGKSQRGPVLGHGPLHPNATSALRDPRIDHTMHTYYWDSAGRRHVRDNTIDDSGKDSLVEKAMEAIRRAAANISAFKLDLKAVFEEFDTSGDGFLSPPEMAQAFLSMGVQLDVESMNAIFKHFDPNDSGAVHYGEFVWAFFNRRNLVRQWKRKTDHMTEAQIKSKFHLADTNGDGRLNPKEFQKLLKSFGMEMKQTDVEILISRFDLDDDGDIDLQEFRAFIESEQRNLMDTTTSTTKTAVGLPPPKTQLYKKGSTSVDDSSAGLRRPKTAAHSGAYREKVGHSPQRPSSAPRSRLSASSVDGISNRTLSSAGKRSAHPLSKSATAHHAASPARSYNPHQTYPRPGDPSRLPTYDELEDLDYEELEGEARGHDSDWRGDSVGASVADMPSLSRGRIATTGAQQQEDVEEDVDVLWVARMLQAQAEVEARLGKKYYS